MKDLAVRVAYLGRDFHGSQIQPGLRTVEGTLLESLIRVTEMGPEELCLRMASRTDKGVNSSGNVASFHWEGDDPIALLKAVNSVSRGVLCNAYAEVDEGFTPRHADMRTYEYVIPKGLDIDLAEECLEVFRGRHDFAGFCKAEGKDTVIDLVRADIAEEDDLLVITFSADHFLWNMVRRMVSTVIRVSEGRVPISKVVNAFEGGWSNFGLAAPEGLTLTDVHYEGIEFIPTDDPAYRFVKNRELHQSRILTRFYEKI